MSEVEREDTEERGDDTGEGKDEGRGRERGSKVAAMEGGDKSVERDEGRRLRRSESER